MARQLLLQPDSVGRFLAATAEERLLVHGVAIGG